MGLRTVERGEQLTGQLLTFARRQPLAVERVDLNARLRRMRELLAQTVGRGIRVETDLAPDLWPVDADPGQLDLAVINLAINARDAMPEGGALRLRTGNVTLSGKGADAAAGGDFVTLSVSDTGTGMASEVAARAFEPFFTTKGPGKGTGLGLSMVYGFARQSGGSATIGSTPGAGTTVTLHLPKSRAPSVVAADAPAGLPRTGQP
jgi:signal transduction histidine kinase